MRSLEKHSNIVWFHYLSIIKRSIALFFLLDLLWRGYSHLLVSQIENPPLQFIRQHYLFHLYKLLGLQSFIVANSIVAALFDGLLILSLLLVLIIPKNKWVNYTAFVLFFIYAIISPVHLGFSAHYLSGMVIISLIFLFNCKSNFSLIIEGLRYYVMWVYSSAFVWKMLNGAMWHWENGTIVLKRNIAQYLLLNPTSAMSSIYYWAFKYPNLINGLAIATYLLEGAFIFGFFTKKYDTLLIVFIICIHFGLYLTVDTLFVEWYLFILLLIPISRWQSWSKGFPLLNK